MNFFPSDQSTNKDLNPLFCNSLQELLRDHVIVTKMKNVDLENVNARNDTRELKEENVLEETCLVKQMNNTNFIIL